MKIHYLLFILIAFVSCKVKTESITSNTSKHNNLMKTECPVEGECSIQLLKNKQLLIKTEETTGNLYPKITAGNNLVIEFNYTKASPENIADGTYSETIHFEIPSDFTELKKKNNDLVAVNLLYGKHCFCEEAGYYAVSEGELIVQKQDTRIHLELTFKVDGIDSEIHHIVEVIDAE